MILLIIICGIHRAIQIIRYRNSVMGISLTSLTIRVYNIIATHFATWNLDDSPAHPKPRVHVIKLV
jgi:hypothetical protein